MPLPLGETAYWLDSDGGDFASPLSTDWHRAPAYQVELTLAPPVHPSVQLRHQADTPPRPVRLQAARSSERLYLRLRWADSSADQQTSRTAFADAAAVQFPVGAAAQTSFMMGGPGQQVNLWYWRAGLEQPQNLAAAGFGSTTELQQGSLTAQSYHDGSHWNLVLSRELNESGELQASLQESAALGLALWDGDGKQRDGLKHVTMGWVPLAPQPKG